MLNTCKCNKTRMPLYRENMCNFCYSSCNVGVSPKRAKKWDLKPEFSAPASTE